MPTLQTFTEFVNSLGGLAKTRTFSLQIHGKFDCPEAGFVRLLRASYEPAIENASEVSRAPFGNGTTIRYEVEQEAMEEVLASITSESGTVGITSNRGIRVPVDKQQPEDYQLQHGSQRNAVHENQETENENEVRLYESDERVAHTASFGWRGSVGESDADDEDEGHPDAMDADDESVHGVTDVPITPILPSVRFQALAGDDDHDAWSPRDSVQRSSTVWPSVQDNEIDPLDSGGRGMSTHRGDARLEYRTHPIHRPA